MELQELLAHYGKERLTILRLDVLDEASIEAAADVVEQRFGRCDLLINASGVLHIPGELQPGARALGRARSSVRACLRLTRRLLAETALAALTVDALTYAYRVNAIGACTRAALSPIVALSLQPRRSDAGAQSFFAAAAAHRGRERDAQRQHRGAHGGCQPVCARVQHPRKPAGRLALVPRLQNGAQHAHQKRRRGAGPGQRARHLPAAAPRHRGHRPVAPVQPQRCAAAQRACLRRASPRAHAARGAVPAKMLFTAETAVRCLLHVIAKAGPDDSGKLLCWDGTTVDW